MTTDVMNGAARGRAAPDEPLEAVTFSTGRSVQVRKVSALLRERIRRAARDALRNEEPRPPLVEVDYGQGKTTIEHRGDPVFLDLSRQHDARITERAGEQIKRIAVTRGVVCDIDPEAVATVRDDLAALGITLDDEDDLWIYVAYVCIGAYDDWTDLLRAIFEKSAPSEAAIAAHQDLFRRDLRRDTDQSSEPGSASGEAAL